MTPKELLNQDLEASAQTLRATHAAFAIATVVRTVNATSAKPGAKALILADGSIKEGWIGGGCIRSAVGEAAIEALRDGAPKFISLRPKDVLQRNGIVAGTEIDGTKFACNGCPSQGSMDVFVEPVLPQPELVIIGRSPVAEALMRLAQGFDFAILITSGKTAKPAQTLTHRYIVVASQGKQDQLCLMAALDFRSDYVAFVGSRKKFAALSEKLVEDGYERAALERVVAPAGLRIEAETPDEIALSILAQVVQLRRCTNRQHGTVNV